jgi:WD40 repeat protein
MILFLLFSSFRVLRDHKCHKQTLTCLALSSDAKFIFSGSKDSGLVMWDLNTGQKLARLPGGRKQTEAVHMGHCTTINAVAVSTDSQFLVSFNFSEFSILKKFPSLEP